MLEPYYSNLYRNVWLRFRNYTKYLNESRDYRDLEWNYPFENFQGALTGWPVTGTWSFLGPFAEKWDMRAGMTEDGQGMPDWAWGAWITAHGHEIEQDWETMAQVYKSCKELMDLTRAYLLPTPAKQVVGSDVFPEVLSASLKPKAAPYPRTTAPSPMAPACPKLAELASIRPPTERKRTIAGNTGGAPKKATLPPRPPQLTPSAGGTSAASSAAAAWKMNTEAGAWARHATAMPKAMPKTMSPAVASSTQWNTGGCGDSGGWGGSSLSQAPPPPPPPAHPSVDPPSDWSM